MNEKIRKERALKVDNGFKISILCLQSDETSPEQKLSIAQAVKTSLLRIKKIIEKNQNPRLFVNISREEQDFINSFLPEEEKFDVLSK